MDQPKGKPKKILSVKFYKSLNGIEPVRKWLKSLPEEYRKIIGEDIKTVELGWPIGMPFIKSLGNNLWEVRSSFPNGITRVIFVVKKNEMILLHGFIKKTQKTSKRDLDLDKKRLKNLEV